MNAFSSAFSNDFDIQQISFGPSISFSIKLGTSYAGLTLRGQFVDTSGNNVGFSFTEGFIEFGNGDYGLTTLRPESLTTGFLKIYNGSTYLASTVITPSIASPVNVTVTPLTSTVSTPLADDQSIRVYTNTEQAVTWTVVDAAGNPVVLTGHTVRWTLYSQTIPTNTLQEVETDSTGGEISIDSNTVTLQLSLSDTSTAGSYRYSLRDITAGLVLAKGKFTIDAIP